MKQRKKPLFFYGWLIVIIALVIMTLSYGVLFSFSVFYVAILDEFGWSRAETALMFSMNIATLGLVAPIAGILVDRFGPRMLMPIGAIVLALGSGLCSQADKIWHFYLLYGIVMAIGTCLAGFVPLTAVISNWFTRRRGTAFAIFSAGWGTSSMMPMLSQYFVSNWGWRQAYLFLAVIIAAIIVPLALLLRHRPEDMGLLADGAVQETQASNEAKGVEEGMIIVNKEWVSTEWTVAKAMRTYPFWALCLANLLLWGLGVDILWAHQVRFFVDVGFSAMLAASVVGFYGVMNTAGNLGGIISDRIGRESTVTWGTIGALLGVSVLFLIRDSSLPWLLYLYATLFGLGIGVCGPPLIAAAADLFQGKSFGSINGFMAMGIAVGGSLGPWLGGYIFDTIGSYVPVFFVMLAALSAACIFTWTAAPRKVRRVPRATKQI